MKKLGLSVLFLAYFWLITSFNLQSSFSEKSMLPHILPIFATNLRVPHIVAQGDQALHFIGSTLGIRNLWRMFTPAPQSNWYIDVFGVSQTGVMVMLPLPHQSSRTFWQRNFVDIREDKYHLELHNRPEVRFYYAQYLCRTYKEIIRDDILQTVGIRFSSRLIAPPKNPLVQSPLLWDPPFLFDCTTP